MCKMAATGHQASEMANKALNMCPQEYRDHWEEYASGSTASVGLTSLPISREPLGARRLHRLVGQSTRPPLDRPRSRSCRLTASRSRTVGRRIRAC